MEAELVIPQRCCGALLQNPAVLIYELLVKREALCKDSWAFFSFKGLWQLKLDSEIDFVNCR